jgi:probable addiction module antidote protein
VLRSRRVIGGHKESDGAVMSALLSEALESGCQDRIVGIINAVARARGMTSLAKTSGLNRTVLYAALRSGGNPSLATLLAIIKGLGLKLSTEVASTVEDGPGGGDGFADSRGPGSGR